jgi:hypothetical protein
MLTICPRCMNEFDPVTAEVSRRDCETGICRPCSEEEKMVDLGFVRAEALQVYERESRIRNLCIDERYYFTDAGAEFMRECYIRKVISEILIPRIRRTEE